MAQAFPDSTVRRLRLPRRLDRDRAATARPTAGVGDRVDVRGRPPPTRFAGTGYDLVTTFDALHDMGDPVGAARHVREALADDGTWMIVEPAAGDRVEDNLNPVGRAYYGFSTLLCTPGVAVPGRRPGAGHAGRPGPDPRRRDRRRVHPVPGRGADPVQQRLRGPAVTDDTAVRPDDDDRVTAEPAGAARPARVGPAPDATASPRATTSTATGESDGDGRADGRCCCRPGRSCRRGSGRRRSVPGPALRVVTFDGRGSGRSGRPAGAAAYTDARVRGRHPRRARRHRRPTGPCWSRCPAGPPGRCTSAAEHPERVLGLVAIAPGVRLRRRRARTGDGVALDRPLDRIRGLGEVQQVLLAATATTTTSPVLLRADVLRAALHQADRGLPRLGATRSTPQMLVDTTAGRLGCDGAVCSRPRAALRRGCGARSPWSTAPRTGSAPLAHRRAARRAHRRQRSSLVEGAGHGLAGPRPGAGQPR